MRPIIIASAAAALMLAGTVAQGQSWQPPADSQRCPSKWKWGAGDERGSANLMNSETVLRAVRLIRAGEVIELGHVLSAAIPLSARRETRLRIRVHHRAAQDTRRDWINGRAHRDSIVGFNSGTDV